MGTLTAGQPRLPEYCEHKLPTSCRLSSIPNCCACADERGHAAEYRTYIDGTGFVPRGTRWQRYCWFCKEFWANRVQISGLRPAQTRIPEVPEQGEFLARWYEFWQGYRVTGRDDSGNEVRQAVLGESLEDVSPGTLPRTLEELRAGRERSEADRQIERRASESRAEDSGPSLDSALDALLEEATVEENETAQPTQQPLNTLSNHPLPAGASAQQPARQADAEIVARANARTREHQARRIAALRRELHRMRTGLERVISGLRDLGEDIPDERETTTLLTDLSNSLDNSNTTALTQNQATRAISSLNALASQPRSSQQDRALTNLQTHVDEARERLEQARQARDQLASDLEQADQQFQISQETFRIVQRDLRTAENYMRVFGTREQFLQAGDSYESPIGGMFTRAFERYRAAEQVRQEERTLRQVLEDEVVAGGGENLARRLEEIDAMERDVWGVPSGQYETQRPDDGAPEVANIERQDASHAPIEFAPNDAHPSEAHEEMSDDPSAGGHGNYERSSQQTTSDLKEDISRVLDLFRNGLSQTTREALMLLDPDWSRERILDIGTRIVFSEASQDNDAESFLCGVMGNEDVLFTAKIPELWISRAYARGFFKFRERNIHDSDVEVRVWNIEMMAHAYMSSSSIRSHASLSPPERLHMLYRLQAGNRERHDRAVLAQLLEDEAATESAEQYFANPRENVLAETIAEYRRQEAREGDHSREELDARRRAATAFAVAAGRRAMRNVTNLTSSVQEPLDNIIREPYDLPAATGGRNHLVTRRRMDNSINNTNTRSEGDSDDDDDDDHSSTRSLYPGPLDAKDTGRPEPKTDEDMTLKLDCKVCYSQTADIACLPCGHLVMCKWCSDQHSPVMAHDRTRPKVAAGCPVCRKGIKQKVRVFRA